MEILEGELLQENERILTHWSMDCGGGAASSQVVVIGVQMEWALSPTLVQGTVRCNINELIGKSVLSSPGYSFLC